MFTIGEFSKVTGMTVKALRFYHEAGLIVPAYVDDETGYRYYHESQIDRARAVAYLRGHEFPVSEIAEILRHDTGGEDERVLDVIIRRREAIEAQIRHLRGISRSLARLIAHERQVQDMVTSSFEVQETTLAPLLVAAVRMKGRYQDCGQGFSRIGRALGRFIAGPPFLLHHDEEYRDTDADFEACFPMKPQAQSKAAAGIDVRTLPGGRCFTLRHKGPYDQLGPAYARILGTLKAQGCAVLMPTREVYLKGPGMIFKGNPRNYLTEIQILVTSPSG
jgi:DNA-binding transcriptional MerR regulator/effector-binding domain-containing protein